MRKKKREKDGLSNGTPPALLRQGSFTWNKRKKKRIHGGLIRESLPNGILQIPLDNEDLILGYVSGRIQSSFIRIPPWDRVNKSEGSTYDSTKGSLIYRLHNKDSND